MRDLVNTYYALIYPASQPLEMSSEYLRLRETIVTQEHQLLRSVRFQVDVQTPYAFLLNYGNTFQFSKDVVRYACALLNDCMATDACVTQAAHVLAAAALTAAAAVLNESGGGGANGSVRDPRRWYLQCDVTDEALQRAVVVLLAVQLPADAPNAAASSSSSSSR